MSLRATKERGNPVVDRDCFVAHYRGVPRNDNECAFLNSLVTVLTMMNENKNLDPASREYGGQAKKKTSAIFVLVIIAIIIIAVVGVFVFGGAQNKSTPQIADNSQNKRYKNGTYSAVGDYVSPGGAEQIGVTVTLKGDVIEDAQVQSMAFRPNTIRFQGIFIENFKPFVVGKNIDEVQLDKVSASSLTPKGFNDAIEKIKAEAKT